MEQLPISEQEFLRLIESIDAEMRAENLPMHARPLQAVTRIGKRLKVRMMLAPPDKTTKLIYDWFDKRYANRLKKDFASENWPFCCAMIFTNLNFLKY